MPAALGLSFLTGAGIKTGGKCFGAKANNREYDGKNLLYDIVTGGVNGLFAPVTNGLGSSLTKTVGAKLGLEILGDTAEAGAKTTLKSILLNQSIDVAGGNIRKRALALGAGMALDGALGGATDNTTRAALEGQDAEGIAKAGLQGFIGGLIMSPIIGGGFRMAGKLGSKLGQKLKGKPPDTSGSVPIIKPDTDATAQTADAGINVSNGSSQAADIHANGTETPTTKPDNPEIKPKKPSSASADTDNHAPIHSPDAEVQVKPVITPCPQPVDVQQARLSELTQINSAIKDPFGKRLDDEFMERASKEFSPERYNFLIDLINANSTNELSFYRIPEIIDNCPDEKIPILKDLVKLPDCNKDYGQMSLFDFEEILNLNMQELTCARDILLKQTEEHTVIPRDIIKNVKGLDENQLKVFKEFSRIEDVPSCKQLEADRVREIALSMPPENAEYAKKALSKNPYDADAVLERFSKCSKERAILLNNMYDFLASDSGKRIYESDMGSFLDEATDKELELAKKLLSLQKDNGEFVIDNTLYWYDDGVSKRESLTKTFFKNHSEAKFELIDEFSKYSKNSSKISDILHYFDDKQADFVKRNLYIEGRSDEMQFYNQPMCNLAHIKGDKTDLIEKSGLLYIPERGSNQFNALELSHLSSLDENTMQAAKKRGLFTMKRSGDSYINGYDIAKLAEIDDVNWQKAKQILHVKERSNTDQFDSLDIKKLSALDDAEFERAKQFEADSIIELAKLDPKQIEIAKQRGLLINSKYGGDSIKELISLTDDEFKRIEPFMNNKNGVFDGLSLKKFATTLTDEELERAKTLIYIPERFDPFGTYYWNEQFTPDQIMALSKLSDDKLNDVRYFFNVKDRRYRPFKSEEIVKLAELSQSELKTAQELSFVPQRGDFQQFGADDIIKLSKLSPKELKKAEKYIYSEDYVLQQLKGSQVALLQRYEGVKSVDSLTISQKRRLLKDLVNENSNLFYNKQDYMKLAGCGVLPGNKDEYCTLLPRLVKSIGISTNELSDNVKKGFYDTMASIEAPDSAFRNFDFAKQGLKIDLTYPRAKFVSDIADILAPLTKEERNVVCSYFGFEIISKEGKNFMNGYPVNLNNGVEFAKIDSPKLKNIIEKMRPLVKEFSENNSVTIKGEPELSEELNVIIGAFPEFITEIGRKQHHTHDFTLDIHSLKVLQGVVNNPKYDALPDDDKIALKIAALLHDITKQENLRDVIHPSESAYDVYYLLQKLGLSEDEKLKIYQIIKEHNWLQKYNTPDDMQRTRIAKDIAFDLRKGNSFEMASILTEADMKAVKRDGKFFEGFQGVMEQGEREVGGYVKQIKESSICLPQTKIPKASSIKVDGDKVKDVVTTLSDGTKITNRVIYLEPDMDLSQYGFENGLNSDDLNVLIHALDNEESSTIFQALGQIDSDALLSASYVNYAQQNYRGFRNQGFVLDVDSDDINAGYYRDFGSGYGKSLEGLKNGYLFKGKNQEYREYISKELKKLLNLDDEQYIKLYNKIKNKSILELDKEYPEVGKAMRELFKRMEGGKRAHDRQYNEMLVTRPKIQAVFDYGDSSDISKIPAYLRQYAAENNLPIIYFGK